MPDIRSKRQFRLVQGIAHGMKSRRAKSLGIAEAKRAIAEMKASRRSYASLPERVNQSRRAARRRRMR